MSLSAYIRDRAWRGPGYPFGEPYAQGLGALTAYVADKSWRGPGAPFGLGQDPTLDGGADDLSSYLTALAGPAGPNASGYGAGGTGSTSAFLQSVANAASAGSTSLPTGAQAAAAFPSIPTWVWLAGGVGVALFLAGAFKGGRR